MAQQQHSMCESWRIRMCENIRDRKWTELVPLSCDTYQTCYYKSLAVHLHPMSYLFRDRSLEMTREVEEAVERLNGPMTAEKWFQYFRGHIPSISLLRYLYGNNRIQVDQNAPYNLLVRYISFDDVAKFLIEEMGSNIDIICGEEGCSALVQRLKSVYESVKHNMNTRRNIEALRGDGDDDGDGDDIFRFVLPNAPLPSQRYLDMCLKNAEYLMEHGADPLLESKTGVSALSYVENLDDLAYDETMIRECPHFIGHYEALIDLIQYYM